MNKKDEKFLWGAVNIGQQTEGDVLSDWSRWADRGQVPEIGSANNYWEQYDAYHEILDDLGCNAFRLSIEWARIESVEGEFDAAAVAHYRKILINLKKRNIYTVVGLWHWSVPTWFEDDYGLHKKTGAIKFLHFTEQVRDVLGDVIDSVVILNEPNVFLATSYGSGERPPFFTDRAKKLFAKRNLIHIHRAVYSSWKKRYPNTIVGSTFLWNHEYGAHGTCLQKLYISIKQYFWVRAWIEKIKKSSDYIGINYYTSDGVFFGKSGGRWGVHGTNDWHDPDVWMSFPKGLYSVLMQMKKYQKPIYILENGKPTNSGFSDEDRCQFLTESIQYMKKAMDESVDVRGYFHYSLCDSYEWNSGYDFKFGLVEFDRKKSILRKRKSCEVYAQTIENDLQE